MTLNVNISCLCSSLTLNAKLREAVNLYLEAYDLLREILNDEALNNFVFKETGKHLAVIDSGAQITIPSARISFIGGEISYSDNIMQTARYNVAFMLPFWGDNAFYVCQEFLDIAANAFFGYEQHQNPVRVNRVIRINPSVIEQDDDSESWTVAFDVTVSIFI